MTPPKKRNGPRSRRRPVKDDQRPTKGPSAREERFCIEYLKDGNGAQSAIRAGYNPKHASQQGVTLLSKPHVRLRLYELRAQIRTEAILSAQETMEGVSQIADGDMATFFTVEHGILTCRDFSILPKGATKLIRKIRQRFVMVGRKLQPVVELELYDRQVAQRLLAEYWNILKTGQQANAPDLKKEFADLADAIQGSHGH